MGLCVWIWLINNDYLSLYPCTPTLSVSVVCVCVCVCVCARVRVGLSPTLSPQQMDDAVYTFEQILHQSLEAQGTEGLCKTIQRCQDRVIKVLKEPSHGQALHHYVPHSSPHSFVKS